MHCYGSDALALIPPDDGPLFLAKAKEIRARERLEFISDMRTALARTKEEREAALPSLISLAKTASGGLSR